MHCTPDSHAVEALGERIAEQLKEQVNGIAQRLSAKGDMADSLLAWFELEVMCAMKGVGQSLLAGLCTLLVDRYAVADVLQGRPELGVHVALQHIYDLPAPRVIR